MYSRGVASGRQGSTFAVLAEEMVKFSQAIKAINLDIQRSLTAVSERIGVLPRTNRDHEGENLVRFPTICRDRCRRFKRELMN